MWLRGVMVMGLKMTGIDRMGMFGARNARKKHERHERTIPRPRPALSTCRERMRPVERQAPATGRQGERSRKGIQRLADRSLRLWFRYAHR